MKRRRPPKPRQPPRERRSNFFSTSTPVNLRRFFVRLARVLNFTLPFMKILLRFTFIFALFSIAALTPAAAEDYLPGPDSKPQPGVPQGELIKFEFASAKIFSGTTREVTIYVPRQYDGTKPACVYVNQDGVQWNAS